MMMDITDKWLPIRVCATEQGQSCFAEVSRAKHDDPGHLLLRPPSATDPPFSVHNTHTHIQTLKSEGLAIERSRVRISSMAHGSSRSHTHTASVTRDFISDNVHMMTKQKRENANDNGK